MLTDAQKKQIEWQRSIKIKALLTLTCKQCSGVINQGAAAVWTRTKDQSRGGFIFHPQCFESAKAE